MKYLLLLILLSTPALAADFDLGRVNYPDPVVGVTYNEAVKLLDDETNLYQIASTNIFIGLDFDPAADTSYSSSYEIRPASQNGLDEGRYRLEVLAENVLGLTNPVLETVEFDVTGLRGQLAQPASGYSPVSPFELVFATYVFGENEAIIPFNAECRYYLGDSVTQPFESLNAFIPSAKITNDPHQYSGGNIGSVHSAEIFSAGGTITVYCKSFKLDGTAIDKLYIEGFSFGVIRENPEIEVTLSPQEVYDEENPFVTVSVLTNQETTCSMTNGVAAQTLLTDTGVSHGLTIRYDVDDGLSEIITSTERTERDYVVTCENYAGRITQEQVTVVIDYSATLTIDLVAPAAVTNADPVVVEARTNSFAVCTIAGETMQEERNLHSLAITTPAQGEQTVTISCTSSIGDREVTFNFTTDRVPPTNVQINASEAICNGEAQALFTAEGAHKYLWTLLDEQGTAVAFGESLDGLVTAQVTASAGLFTWEVVAEDRAGNQVAASPVTVEVFAGNSDECSPGPFIRYHEPELGFATAPFDATIATKRPAVCAARIDLPGLDQDTGHRQIPNIEGLIHEVEAGFSGTQSFHIRCAEDDGTVHYAVLEFGVLTERPRILALAADPNPINNFQERRTTITAETSIETVCTLLGPETIPFDGENEQDASTYTLAHEHELDLSAITDLENQVLDYTVSCKDRAGQVITAPLPITLDFSGSGITVLSPERYTNNPSPDIVVSTAGPSICQFRDPNTGAGGTFNPLETADNLEHTAALSVSLEDGPHSLLIKCTNTVNQDGFATHTFTVDTTPPQMNISANTFVCQDASTAIIFGTQDVSPVTTEITVSTGTSSNTSNTTGDRFVLESAEYAPGSITLQITQTDAAGNTAQTVSRTLDIKVAEDPICLNIPVCGNGEVQEGESCDDGNLESGDGCSATCTVESQLSTCGNNIAELNEQCDGTDIPITTCSLYGLSGTITSCNSDCTVDTSTCDGVLGGPGEEPIDTGNGGETPGLITTPRPVPEYGEIESGFPWLALILVILGILTIGGSSYFLYYEHTNKRPPESTTVSEAPPQLSPEQKAQLLAQEQQRTAQRLAKLKASQEARDVERQKVMSSFDDGKSGETAPQVQSPSQEQSTDSSEQSGENQQENQQEEFTQEKSPNEEQSPEEKKEQKKDPFARLDDILGKK